MKDQLKGTKNIIDLSTAISWVQNWRNKLPTKDPKTTLPNLNGFVIPVVDITQIITDNPGIVSVRGYLGHDGIEYKLMIVGVDANGNDLIDQNTQTNPTLHNIYDFTRACPTICDVNSNLITLQPYK